MTEELVPVIIETKKTHDKQAGDSGMLREWLTPQNQGSQRSVSQAGCRCCESWGPE